MELEIVKQTKILIIGLCALPMGTMERQFGNMAILIPTIDTIVNEIPGAQISTSLQLSENFCRQYGVTSLKYKSLYEPTLRSGIISLLDYTRTAIWDLCRKRLRIDMRFLITGAKLKEFNSADIVLDFSGDTYGDIGHPLHLLKHSLDLLTAIMLKKPVCMFAQSPGPFSTRFRLFLARIILTKVSAVTVREPVAYKTLRQMNVKASVIQTACPSFLFQPAAAPTVDKILQSEGINADDRPLIGMTIAGFNVSKELISADKYKEKRTEMELIPLVNILKYLLDKLKARVILIPHVFRTDNSGKLVHGPDSKITEQLYMMVSDNMDKHAGTLQMLKQIYSPAETKGIIGHCDLYVSGRLHAGVAALSQCVPTILLAYGHKFYGFAQMLGQEKYVSNNFGGKIDAQDIITKIHDAWINRECISSDLRNKMPEVTKLARLNATIVKELADVVKTTSLLSNLH
jgi:colanic acid/amylovoran biosynthesis protein